MSERPGHGVKHLWTHDPDNDVYYRIDEWGRDGAGRIVPKHAEEVPEERVPADHRRNSIGLNRGVLS